jgi:CheY-like chemotaxis protein
MPRGSESVLVVEDDNDVRSFVVRNLEALGYSVTAAESGPAAIARIENGLDVDLLFTDVVLPNGLNGWQVAEEVRRRRPDVKVLLTSGYTGAEVDHGLRMDEQIELLPKPYNREDLAVVIRSVLDDGEATSALQQDD